MIMQRMQWMPSSSTGWSLYWLSIVSVILPGYSLILCWLRLHIHDIEFAIPVAQLLLIALYLAVARLTFSCWRLSHRVPRRGIISAVISLPLLPDIIAFSIQIP
jgi:hypothetical protein